MAKERAAGPDCPVRDWVNGGLAEVMAFRVAVLVLCLMLPLGFDRFAGRKNRPR